MTFAIYITEMRRYYFIWYEKKLKEKGISVVLLMPQQVIFYSFIIFLRFSPSDSLTLHQLLHSFLLRNEKSIPLYIRV